MITGLLGKLGRLAGMSCYSARGEFSPIWCSWSLFCISTYFIAMVLALYEGVDLSTTEKPTRQILDVVLQLTDVLITFIHFYAQTRNKSEFNKIFKATRKNCKATYNYFAVISTGLFLWMIFDPWDDLGRGNKSFWNARRPDLIIMYHYLVSVIVLQFSAILSSLSSHLKLTRCHRANEPPAIHRHAQLTSLVRSVNRLWDLQLLLISFHIFGYVLLLVFESVNPFVNGSYWSMDLRQFINIGILLTMTLAELVWLASTCQSTAYHADSFNDALFKIMELRPTYTKDEKLSMYLSFNETVRISACGFFELGYPMITAITATTASYLVILLQNLDE